MRGDFCCIVMSINAFMIITLVCIVRFPMFGDETWEKTPQHAVLSLEHHPGVEDHHKGHQDVRHQDQHKDQHHYEDQYAEQHEITLRITMRIIMRISIKINIRIIMRISIKINIKISKRITITLGPILESLSWSAWQPHWWYTTNMTWYTHWKYLLYQNE